MSLATPHSLRDRQRSSGLTHTHACISPGGISTNRSGCLKKREENFTPTHSPVHTQTSEVWLTSHHTSEWWMFWCRSVNRYSLLKEIAQSKRKNMSLFTHPCVAQVVIFLGNINEKEYNIEEILLKREYFNEHKQNNINSDRTWQGWDKELIFFLEQNIPLHQTF